MVSFDVVSLFTNIPVEDALQAISMLLTQDDDLEECTTIPVPDICELTEMCLQSTYMYFMFVGTFFEQVERAAMGSSLSPVVANLFMEAFEKKLWKRWCLDQNYGSDTWMTHLCCGHIKRMIWRLSTSISTPNIHP